MTCTWVQALRPSITTKKNGSPKNLFSNGLDACLKSLKEDTHEDRGRERSDNCRPKDFGHE